MWGHWVRKCMDESKTVEWITDNTKFCPKCHKPVQKNGGCNLVHCICGQPFCWLCGGATGLAHTWSSIADHECGRYKEKHGELSMQEKNYGATLTIITAIKHIRILLRLKKNCSRR